MYKKVLWLSQNLLESILKLSASFCLQLRESFPHGSAGKESTCNVGDLGSIPGLGISSGEGKDYPLQNSDLENSMDCIGHGVTKSWTRLSDFHFQGRVWFLARCWEREKTTGWKFQYLGYWWISSCSWLLHFLSVLDAVPDSLSISI